MVSAMYLLRRLLSTILVLGLLSAALFYLFHLMPGPADAQILAQNPNLSEAEVVRLRGLMGLDRSIAERYACWVVGRGPSTCVWWPSDGLIRGDLGHSQVHGRSVRALVGARFPNTLRLMLPALLLALLLAVPLGVWAASRRDELPDRLVGLFTFSFVASPIHWVALIAILLFALKLDWFPTGGVAPIGDDSVAGLLHHALLPALISALFFTARFTRHLRFSMLEILPEEYLVAARARGLSERRILWRHALPNALLPLITVVTQSLPALFSGTLVIERVFGYPGIGLLIFESIDQDDHLVAVVVVLVAAAITIFSMALADVLYRVADPRLRRT